MSPSNAASRKATTWTTLKRQSMALATMLAALSAHAGSLTRTSAFEYDASGLLNKEIVEPANSDLCVVTTYTLDPTTGNRTGATTRNCSGASSEAAAPTSGSAAIFTSRSVSTVYSTDGRFPLSNTNALGQSETKTFNPTLGVLTSLTGPNGLTTSWAYDGFGRKVLEKRADGNGTRWKYEYCSPANGSNLSCAAVPAVVTGSTSVTPAYVVTSTPVKLASITVNADGRSTDGGDGGANGAYGKVYYDTLGRVIRTETQGDDLVGTSTKTVYQDTAYDSLGHVLAKSRPYYQGAAQTYWVTYAYDKLNRVLTETLPDGSKTTTSYQGLVTSVTNDKGQTLTETRNVAGQVVSIKDANSKTLSKTYDAYGNLLTTTDALGNVIILTYDLKGRKTGMLDPDMGSWSYVYNALGELKTQTDAKSQVTTMTYDLLGRLTQKSEPTLTSNWYYDKYQSDATWQTSTCAKGIGKLCEVASNNGYGRKHAYDSYGRASSTASTIGSTYTSSTTYTSDGRADTVSYPSRDASNNPILRIKNVYSALGYLKQVINADSPSNIYWKAEAIDAEGHLTQQTTGNLITTQYGFDPVTGRLLNIKAGATGSSSYAVENATYAYDTLGNLKTSGDSAVGASAIYTYDSINRLTNESRLGTAITTAQSITWAYNEIGNITSRTDVGTAYTYTYSYPASGVGSVRPHAVSGVAGTVNGIASPSYNYDANGNLISATGRTVSWTSFNKVNTITQTSGSTTNVLGYTYDAEGERVKETLTQNGTLQRTTIYLNPGAGAGLFYEEEITPTATKQKHYLNAMGDTLALLIYNKTASTWTTEYWHKDNLGSTVAVTDQVGAVTERMSYEPFGKRRKTDGTTDLLGTLAPSMTRRGFTGHEMIDEVGLVNMNGRIFDPAISRFLSADPYIQAANNLQSFNRYSYGLNSPTGGTDPSGYNFFKEAMKIGDKIGVTGLQSAGNFIGAYVLQRMIDSSNSYQYRSYGVQIGSKFCMGWAAACQAAGTYALNRAYGMSNKEALKSGAISYAQGYANENIPSGWSPFAQILAEKAIAGAARVASGGQFWAGVRGSFKVDYIGALIQFGDNAYHEYDSSYGATYSKAETGEDVVPSGSTASEQSGAAITGSDNKAEDFQVAQLAPSLILTEPPLLSRIAPLDELPLGSAGGPGAGKVFPRSLNNNQPEGVPCTYCGTPTTKQPGPTQLNGDHVIPKAQGGNNTPGNYAPSCRTCNLQKGNKTPQQWRPGFYDARWYESLQTIVFS